MNRQDWLWAGAVAALALVAWAIAADQRRARRAFLDRPGWVPWREVQVFAWFASAVLAMLAMAS